MPNLQTVKQVVTPANDQQLKLPSDTITVKISVAMQMTGIGKTKMYELIKDGHIEVIKLGTATLVPVDSLRRFLDGLRRRPPSSSGKHQLDA